MPAETHSRRDAVTAADIVELIGSILVDTDPASTLEDLVLASVGVDDDGALLELWDATAEEFGERTLVLEDIDVCLEAFREADTVGELAQAFARLCQPDGGDRSTSS